MVPSHSKNANNSSINAKKEGAQVIVGVGTPTTVELQEQGCHHPTVVPSHSRNATNSIMLKKEGTQVTVQAPATEGITKTRKRRGRTPTTSETPAIA